MKYYLVTAKCGHVGNGKYLEINFPIYAESKSDAAQKCLKRGKVKKHLKNAISFVQEISFEEFQEELIQFRNNGFVKAHTKNEVIEYLDDVQELEHKRSWKKSFNDRKERILYMMKKNKIMEDCIYA